MAANICCGNNELDGSASLCTVQGACASSFCHDQNPLEASGTSLRWGQCLAYIPSI